MSSNVDGAQVEEIDAFIYEQYDFLFSTWVVIDRLGDSNEVAIIAPYQRNRLRLRPIVMGKRDSRAGNPLK